MLDEIGITAGGIAGDQLSDKAGEEQLASEEHTGERDIKRRSIRKRERAPILQLLDHQGNGLAESDEAANDTKWAEEMHGPLAVLADKGDRHQIEQPFQPPAKTAEFRAAVLAGPVLYHFLTDVPEAGPFGNDGDIAVHFAIDLDALDHLVAVGLETAIEIVQPDLTDPGGGPVEEFGRNGLGDRVMAYFLPAAHHIVVILEDHPAQLGDLIRAVLHIGVHRDHHDATRGLEPLVQRGRFAIIALEPDAFDIGVVLAEGRDHLPAPVGAAIIHKDDLIGKTALLHHALDPAAQFGQGLVF